MLLCPPHPSMPSTNDQRPLSYISFTERPRSTQRPRTAGPHYRPVSTILFRPPPERQPDPRRSIRPVSCVSDFLKDMKLREPVKAPPPTKGSDRTFNPCNIFLRRLKAKRSLPLLDTANIEPQRPLASSRPPSPAIGHPPLDRHASVADKINWIRRGNATLHPYPHEAPYMQSYDATLLENDRYTDLLLQRLTPEGSPTFHDYGKKPPQSILDLGCGQGHWILAAAEAWKSSRFIGFDLVDLTSHIEKPDNVTFIKGNFLKRKLPFGDKQFDLVRMANLSLCIPQTKWEALLTEVFRVLVVGGRLELIDDHIIFPYGPTPNSRTRRARPTSRSAFDPDDNSDDEDTLYGSTDTASTLSDMDDLANVEEKVNSSIDLKPLRRYSNLSTTDDCKKIAVERPTSRILTSPLVDWPRWSHQVQQCRNLETVFGNMLKTKYDIDLCPSDYLLDVLNFVFGKGAGKQQTFHLKLAPHNISDFFPISGGHSSPDVLSDKDDDWSPHSSDPGPGFPAPTKTLTLTGWDRRNRQNKKLSADTTGGQDMLLVPDWLSAKAAGRLGITYSALAAAAVASVRDRSRIARTQSPGLILWPSTYLPVSPLELEMHACKNIHALLGCKYALETYMQSFEETDGRKFMDHHIIRDVLWEYECFRRERFHWPTDVPDVHLEAHHTSEIPTIFLDQHHASDRSPRRIGTESSISPFTEDDLTHVRTVHVFEAVKTDDYSLAHLQFPRYPAPAPPNRL